MQAKFAPDVVAAVMAEFEEGELQTNHEIFDVCIQGTEKPAGRVDLDAAFARYLERWNPYSLGNADLRKMSPRFLAARAFDFAIWMGILAELPLEQGGKRGAT